MSPTAPPTAPPTEDLAEKKRKLLELMLAERKAGRARQGAEPAFPRADRSQPLPLSYVQQRLWFLSQLDPASPAYNVPAAVYLEGPLDPAKLAAAWRRTLARHEDLRTNFHTSADGEPYAVITAELPLPLPVVDLSALALGAAEEIAQQLVPAVSFVPFDIARDPLLRFVLVRLSPRAHVLLLVIHHIIGDVWSVGVFFHDLGAFYDALAAGTAPRLLPLALQYADYVAWQRRQLEGTGELDRQLDYWLRQLGDAPPVLELPTDLPRPAQQTFRGRRYAMHLGGDVHKRLLALAKPEEASLYMAALAVFYALLHRYTGQRDLLVGTPMANRNRVEFEALVGFFVNTVVLRGRLDGDLSFRQLLRQVRTTCLEAFSHHDLPFDRVVNALRLPRDLSRNPLYQVDFAFQNLPAVELATPGLTLKPFVLRETTSRFDLELDLKEAPDGFDGFIRYNTALFAPTTIERMARHYHALLETALAEPDRPLAALPMLDPAERRELIETWNRTARPLPAVASAGELISAQAARTPAATAAISPDGTAVSFAELETRAGLLARHLLEHGTAAGEVVAIASTRRVEVLVAILAIWKAGAAYLPLDTAHPPARLRFQLADAGVRRVLATAELAAELPWLGADGRALDVLDALPATGEPAAPVAVSGESAAYVLYTSGSTGRPKGVVVPHRGLVNYLGWCCHAYGLETGEGSLAHSSLAFDLTVTSLLAPLAAGRPVRLVAEEGGLDTLAAALAASRDLSLLKITPAHLETLGRLLRPEQLAGRVRALVIGGEALHAETLAPWRRHAPATRLINEYGPTETVVGCSTWEVPAGAAISGVVAIGHPIQNTRLDVVDPRLELVPLGVPGELAIGGAGVARGYLGRPRLSAERFVPDPFGAEPGARLYRSGDRARRRAGGVLEFLGRGDHQVKLRGYRIELGEIEAALAAHPDVQTAAVAVRDDVASGVAALVAWVAAPKARNLGAEELRAVLAAELPDYMVPSFFVFLPALPLTANGKVDRAALPSPLAAAADRDADYVAPRTPTEMQVARIWAEVLGVDRVSVNDRFFDLGGQSMLAVQVVSRVRDALQVELPVQSLFNDTTVATLAAQADAARDRGALAGAPPIVPVPRDRDLPLSFSQERLWLIDRLLPEFATAYHVPGAVRMRGRLDHRALERALATIVSRHEIFRTTYVVRGGRPVQLVAAHAEVTIPIVDLTRLAVEPGHAAGRALAAHEAGRGFDLARGPLLRPCLITLAPDEHLFVLVIHQIAYDMWSRDLFLGELVTLYQAFHAGLEPALPPVRIQYADYAFWQREHLGEQLLGEQLVYWRRQLAGLQAAELVPDRPRPAVQSQHGARCTRVLGEALTRDLKKLARRQKVTLFVALLAGFSALLHRLSGESDVAVGSPVANRNRLETEGVIGFFANTIVLRLAPMGPEVAIAELLERTKTMTLDAFAHQDLPFERLVEELRPQRDLGRQPLFQVMFNYLINYQPPALELPGLAMVPEEIESRGVPFDFMVAAYEAAGRLHVVCDYSTHLFDATTAERALRGFERLLASLAAGRQRRVGELEILAPAERHQLLAEWSDTRRERGVQAFLLSRLLAGQAERTPTTVALRHGEQRLSYAELDERAARLARRLRAAGVGLEDVVAILDERGCDFVLAIVAVLRAGAAYLPLHPLQPEARNLGLLSQSRARVLLAGADFAPAMQRAVAALDPAPRVLDLGAALAEIAAETHGASGEPFAEPPPESLAYVLFTSGSTGVPKGVMVSHAGMLNHLWLMVADLGLGPADRLAQTAAQTFDISVWQMLVTLVCGGEEVIYRDAIAHDPQQLFAAAVRDRITTLQIVPALLGAWLDAPAGTVPERFPDLRWLLVTGEAVAPELAARWLERQPAIPLVNAYGPAECADDVSLHVLRRPFAPDTVARTPIGRPVENLTLYVVDRALRPVAIGVPGELLVGGVGVGRGYLAEPRRSAEAFIPDPFGSAPGARVYRTGDRVRTLADGVLEFFGRIDHQIKIRGYRIEPGEVESVLAQHPAVHECVAICREDVAGDRRLVAYVVGHEGAVLDLQELRRTARERLPDYMVPAAVVALEALPRSAHGKLDRDALPAPGPERPELEACFVAPRTEVETELARIWAEVLKLDQVGVEDSFFDLGGHSLLATQVVLRAAELFDVELPLRSIFDSPTIAELARLVEAVRWARASTGEPPAAAEAGGFEEEGTF